MKKKSSNIILAIIFLMGILTALYPSISNYLNKIGAAQATSDYEKKVSAMSETEKRKFFYDAEKYNEELVKKHFSFINGAPTNDYYKNILNINGNGMIGHISIPKINVNLPIYHGTSDSVLDHYAGHLEGSSFPTGEKNTHSVITGHRGLPAAKLFTDLNNLELGDTFSIKVLDKIFTYEVCDIRTVLPQEVYNLDIQKNEDIITLITCTPYAVNTHRLLVRGVRINVNNSSFIQPDAILINFKYTAASLTLLFSIILISIHLINHKIKKKDKLH